MEAAEPALLARSQELDAAQIALREAERESSAAAAEVRRLEAMAAQAGAETARHTAARERAASDHAAALTELASLAERLEAAQAVPEELEPSTGERDRLAEAAVQARADEVEARLALRAAEEGVRRLEERERHRDLPERRFGGRVFRVGDKVTQIRNNYDKGQNGVFNGTVGVVTALDSDEQRLMVRTDEDEEVPYDFDELDELAHAYAVTIHRSQGSEYPAVVIPVTTSAWMMLQRNLLYTAVTRAKKLVVLVGSRRALGQAVRTVSAGRRCTALDFRLGGGRGSP